MSETWIPNSRKPYILSKHTMKKETKRGGLYHVESFAKLGH